MPCLLWLARNSIETNAFIMQSRVHSFKLMEIYSKIDIFNLGMNNYYEVVRELSSQLCLYFRNPKCVRSQNFEEATYVKMPVRFFISTYTLTIQSFVRIEYLLYYEVTLIINWPNHQSHHMLS